MSLTRLEDKATVEAACAAFLKVCKEQGIKDEQVLQVCVAVGAATMKHEAAGDKTYEKDLLGRFERTFRSALKYAPR
jgi:hypothetical protein